ncbi:family 78 glycoside hydrolase catalytic domain [Olivibacter sp. SDN3]|uniref:alpha-L-rhamnosidase n=1 Tax=Olivibacter sp. SDN3 TaxID=2764720 RepID=UPI0016519D1D|nr:alpha-L-rhamnosidase [Olivibacter sp. SDN3]QNL52256.1 family 78 glycoside hydrolase catalytic domain [Olivibacter sp. SDN3]
MYKALTHIFFIVWLSLPATLVFAGQVGITHLRCELLNNPQGIDVQQPRLSWELVGNQRGLKQVAYQIQVASSPERLKQNQIDYWDSGRITTDSSVHISYGGKILRSRDRCYWRVKVWSSDGQTAWSDVAYWSVGLLNYNDWKGRWIGLDRAFEWDREDQFSRLSARYFRKEFEAKKNIKQATAYIIGLGLYEFYVNGMKIGQQVLAPAPTDYTRDVKYNTFDVTNALLSGKNALGVILGNGRYYAMRQAYKPYKIKTFGYPKLRFNLEVEYTDGTSDYISSDDSWMLTADGPIRTNNEYDGEEYDAQKELMGWNEVGYNDEAWLKAEFVQAPGGMPRAQMSEFMQVMDTLKPQHIHQQSPGVYVLDMGQNMTGWIKIHVKGQAGTQVKMRFAESLQPDGSLFVANLRDAKVTDSYTLKGNGHENWEPRFVYHGFRYVEITGYPGQPSLADFEGMVVYDALETTGKFKSSDATLNRLYQNAFWGIAGNYKGMPLDCPQRNERQPWLGDRTTGAYGESFMFDNAKLYAKWLDDIQAAQMSDGSIPDVAPAYWHYYSDNVTWPGTYLTVADMLYRQYADKRVIEKHYPSMKKWMFYMRDNYTEEGLITKDKYGDWCVPPESAELIHSRDPTRQTDGVLLASSTYLHLLQLMQKFAQLLGAEKDEATFRAMAEKMKIAFNQKFFDTQIKQYSNNTVTANLLPLVYDIVPAEDKKAVFQQLVQKMDDNQRHISTGVIGTQWIMRGLSNFGRPDLAFQLATNTTYPSWGYMAANGATTIWELWNGNTANPNMNSQNHVMLLGDLLIWYFEHVGGIRALQPGFKTIEMQPNFEIPMLWAEASYKSLHGKISSSWKKDGQGIIWKVTIPPNTKAHLYFPTNKEEHVMENKKPAANAEGVKYIKTTDGKIIFEVVAGTYSFTME